MEKTSVVNLGMHILEVEITTRCNLNCKHCYNRNHAVVDMPVEEFKKLYRFAEKHGVWSFIVSGGEALMHPEFSRINAFIKKVPHKFRLVLQTNGTLITDRHIEFLKSFDLVHISFDAVQDVRLYGNCNLDLAKKLISLGIKSYLFVTVHKRNMKLVDLMVKKANNAKVPIGFNICIPTEGIDNSYLMSRDEFEMIEKKLFKLSERKRILRYSSPLAAILDPKKKGRYAGIKGGCAAGIAAAVVSSSGELYPCPFFRMSVGNVFKHSLKKLWLDSAFFNILRNRKEFKAPCGTCEFLSYCGGCRNRAFQKTGDFRAADPMCYKYQTK